MQWRTDILSHTLSRSNFLHFHAVFSKFWPNNSFAHPFELTPPLGNPGSAAAVVDPGFSPGKGASSRDLGGVREGLEMKFLGAHPRGSNFFHFIFILGKI